MTAIKSVDHLLTNVTQSVTRPIDVPSGGFPQSRPASCTGLVSFHKAFRVASNESPSFTSAVPFLQSDFPNDTVPAVPLSLCNLLPCSALQKKKTRVIHKFCTASRGVCPGQETRVCFIGQVGDVCWFTMITGTSVGCSLKGSLVTKTCWCTWVW